MSTVKPIVIAITGGRDHIVTWDEISEFHDIWTSITNGVPYSAVLVHGAACGVDTHIALRIKDSPSFSAKDVISCRVDCSIDGPWPRAGCNRNERMLNTYKPVALIAFPGGYGTEDCIRRAKRKGIKVYYVGCV